MTHTHIKIVFFATLSTFVIASVSCSPPVEERIKAYVETHNQHDVDRVMKFYDQDAKYVMMEGNLEKTGKREIRKLEEFDAATNSHYEIVNIERKSPEIVLCRINEQSDFYKLAGVDTVEKLIHFVFKDTLITNVKVVRSKETREKLGKNFKKFTGWATKNRVEEFEQLLPKGNFRYGQKEARRWMALLQEWKQASSE